MIKKTMRNRISFLTVLFFFVLTTTLYASQTMQGKVMQVKDGDTVVISPLKGGQFFTCRLYGIDAPETSKKGKEGQSYGEDAAKHLKRLVLGKTLEVHTTGQKTYNREVCMLKRDGLNINLEMVKAGYAWAYVQYLKRPHASDYLDAEREARASKRGLWQQTNPTPPWEWRRK
jgi:endonuclease YncB( thermonuclease family)